MAIAAIAAAAAVASAAAGTYGAITSAQNQAAGNRIAAQNYASNRAANTQNSLIDAVNNAQNQQQRTLDNRRYDEAVGREEAQRRIINALATATQRDADGNAVVYDPTTNTWMPVSQGIGRTNVQRRQQQTGADYTQSMLASTLGNMRVQDQLRDAGTAQARQRALAQELLARYATNQGRTPQQMEGAAIERNVAAATDPIRTGGNMAMLAGYRQGNSGNDALMAALARQSQGGTRAAIAQARYEAPTAAYGERDAAAKALLAPATTLEERGNAAPGVASPTFTGDTSGALINAIQRGNAAGVGSQLNPRATSQMGVGRAATNMQAFQPLNANGNMWPGVAESLKSLLTNKDIQNTARWLFGSGGGSVSADRTAMATTPRGIFDQQPVNGNGIEIWR